MNVVLPILYPNPTRSYTPYSLPKKQTMSESESKPTATAEGGGSSTKSAAEPSTSITPPPPATSTTTAEENAIEDDMLLVTEFPPPPYYYTLASRQTPSHLKLTSPPEIPHRAFKVAAKRVHLERQKAREESERIRLEAEEEGQQQQQDITTTTAGGKAGTSSSEATGGGGAESPHQKADIEQEQKQSTSTSTTSADDDDDDSIDLNNPNEPVVAVFGEIVEDPTLVVEEECHDPIEIRDNVKRLNQSVLKGFWMLVQKLVHDPNDNK